MINQTKFIIKIKKKLAFKLIFDIIIHVMTFRDSSMVEHSAVNRRVGGSSPLRGANLKK